MLRKRTDEMFVVALVCLALGCSGGSSQKQDDKKSNDTGDSSKSGKITGTVKYDGKLVPVGTITFIPEKGKTVVAEIEDGKYIAHWVPSGKVIITVDTLTAKKEIKALEEMIQKGPPKPPEGGVAPPDAEKVMKESMAMLKERLAKLKKMVDVPAIYADEITSGLSRTVESGDQKFDFDLKKP